VLPADVIEWVRTVFSTGNARVSDKLDRNPNVPEESLDLTWIEHLSQSSSPVRLPSDWTVQVETHFLGGLRHWGRWEIADIGLLLFADLSPTVAIRKVALLQSKRLYPSAGSVEEETVSDYAIGIGRLADPEVLQRPLSLAREFEFTEDCRYGALVAGSEQVERITEYEDAVGLKVYYQLYNPSTLPFRQRIPLEGQGSAVGSITHGVRVIRANRLHPLLDSLPQHARPSVRDLSGIEGLNDGIGWRLESFVADEWLGCREGDEFGSVGDDPIQRLFYRRSGPISAAISIRVQAPGAVG
jgi:hypothetical protein